MVNVVGYLVREGSISPKGDFASYTINGHCTLWEVSEIVDEMTGKTISFEYDVVAANVEKEDYEEEYNGLEVRFDNWI